MLFAPAKYSDLRAMVESFFKTKKTPIDFEQEIGEGNDGRQWTAMGRFVAAVAGIGTLLLIISNPMKGRLAILSLALVIAVISSLMMKAGKRSDISMPIDNEQQL